ncbi:uncharacterized protein LOC123274010 [Cotesia glomerata]|uniref:uncharacterized protein LOC123274010 n=1 Tax=Cotesia glomerata TaxID=32391 RepID=UPI001D02A762|nr:uncharacterized protein LOC123274010 [Cotesia glomerata]
MSNICFHYGQKTLARRRIPMISIDGYEYMCSKAFPGGMYVICKYKERKNCKFRGKLINNELIISRNHDHARVSNAEKIYNFERSLYEEVTTHHFKSLRIIYDEISSLHHEAAIHVTWVDIYPKMLRWRRQIKPPIPDSIDQYINLIEMPEWNMYTSHNQTNITVITIEDNDHSKSIIYADLEFLRSLNNVFELYIDATFKVVPRKPAFRQLLTILGLVQDSVSLCETPFIQTFIFKHYKI